MLLYFRKIKRHFENFIENFDILENFKENLKKIQEDLIERL